MDIFFQLACLYTNLKLPFKIEFFMNYHTPSNFSDACAIAAKSAGQTRFLAGGTDVLVQMRSDILTPDDLIDVKQIQGVKDIIQNKDGSWTLGIAVTGAEMSEHSEFKKAWPGLVEAADLIGSTQIQGRATIVGNLCNGSPAADSVPAQIAAGATVSIMGPSGERIEAVENIPTGPSETSLKKGEIISAIHIPARRQNTGDAYLRFIPRTEMDIAVVGCAVNLRLENDLIVEARVALGAVAPKVLLVEQCSQAILGTKLDEEALSNLSAAAENACNPISDKRGTKEFRTNVAGVLAARTAKIAYNRAQGKNDE